MSDTGTTTVEASDVDGRRFTCGSCAAIGAAAAIVGLLPWLATGMRLPLQNLWAAATLPEAMPIVLLPFSQYWLSNLFGLIATGSVVAGIVARALRPRLSRAGFALLFAGVLLVQIAATVQSAVVVRNGLQDRTESTLYLAVLVARVHPVDPGRWTRAGLIARAPRAGALIGLTIGRSGCPVDRRCHCGLSRRWRSSGRTRSSDSSSG